MKKIIAVAAVAATTLFAAPAFAQAKNFEGFSVGMNADWINGTSGESGTGTRNQDVSESSLNLGLEATYNLALGNQFVLGFGATYEATKAKAGTFSNGQSVLTKNSTSAYIAPGFAISNSTLIYGKIASIGTTTECNGCSDSTWSGLGYGIGVQSMLDKNWFLKGEAMFNKYDDKTSGATTSTAKSTVVSFGVGYKF